jgi:hypothetical protein
MITLLEEAISDVQALTQREMELKSYTEGNPLLILYRMIHRAYLQIRE